jgi:hypothetical protein
MRQRHEFQHQGSKENLGDENKKKLDSKALAQNKLNEKRYIEDYTFKYYVFKAFEKDVGTGRPFEGSEVRSES